MTEHTGMTEHDREVLIATYHIAWIVLAFAASNIILGVAKLVMMIRVIHATASDRETIRQYAALIQQYGVLFARVEEDGQRELVRASETLKETVRGLKCELKGDDTCEDGDRPRKHDKAPLPGPEIGGMTKEQYVQALKRLIRQKEKEISHDAPS